ncbi:hypothetical protein F5X96DRAFT_210907 [Biscogniauxia mediterranea]|nr:hypothetical protein F5X96DRAFT_210907 [Biscogniauxia mediterranea]
MSPFHPLSLFSVCTYLFPISHPTYPPPPPPLPLHTPSSSYPQSTPRPAGIICTSAELLRLDKSNGSPTKNTTISHSACCFVEREESLVYSADIAVKKNVFFFFFSPLPFLPTCLGTFYSIRPVWFVLHRREIERKGGKEKKPSKLLLEIEYIPSCYRFTRIMYMTT